MKLAYNYLTLARIEEVLAIERVCFEVPWTEQDFIRCTQGRGPFGLTLTRGGQVLGFAVREVRDKTIHLANLAVHPDFRRQGLGTFILNKEKARMNAKRRNRLTALVLETNMIAQNFYKANGFRAVSVLRGAVPDLPDRDAYLLQYRLPETGVGLTLPANRIAALGDNPNVRRRP